MNLVLTQKKLLFLILFSKQRLNVYETTLKFIKKKIKYNTNIL